MKVKTILRWIFCALALICIPACGSFVSALFLVAATLLVAPIKALDEKIKRPLGTIIAVVLFFAAIMFSSPGQSSAATGSSATAQPKVTSTPAPTQKPTSTATPAPEPTTTPEPTAEPTTAPVSTDAPTESTSADDTDIHLSSDDIAALYKVALKDNYDNYTIDTSDDMISISVWGDGVAVGSTYAKLGNETALSSWNSLVDSMVAMDKSFVELAEASGRDDLIVVVNVLNDQDTTKTLLTVANGVVFYNSVSDD